ncbi:EamA domain-containing membrane protein RarD [Salinimicrobium catena]|uniref:EamA domain-containing membrane protein RarD n=1 Tax=Salinimicrobium catena TaxID=390640 RepID=A0A1H5JFE7_9FLAO|nr:DMT family transporter [Salinimicrobium catena]SDK87284.1 EamA domain-containing membrane protein RarD [Salinimicrobium catena]SEE51236.1 EamA domain-containing membrane protein RarD [Salinimicrobium catena]
MPDKNLKWVYLGLLSLIWGSSFILIKKGLVGLTALQVGSLRVVFAALFLILVGLRSLRHLKGGQWKWIAFSGFFGTFFPAYLFSYAETQIDSAIVSILNSTTPLLSMLLGVFIFEAAFVKRKFIGVLIGLAGTTALILSGAALNPGQNYWYSLLVILASLFYGMNANVIKRHLQTIPALAITTGNFMVILIPALIVLFSTGFFSAEVLTAPDVPLSLMFVAILGMIGTGAALIMFNKLIQISDPVFSTSVTYLVPIVALGWGILDGENFSFFQLLSGVVILVGVWVVNSRKKNS